MAAGGNRAESAWLAWSTFASASEKKLGLTVVSEKVIGDERVYKIA